MVSPGLALMQLPLSVLVLSIFFISIIIGNDLVNWFMIFLPKFAKKGDFGYNKALARLALRKAYKRWRALR